MFSVQKISDAGAAFHYFTDRDDYYLSDASAAEWFGAGAERAGLTGAVGIDDFRAVLEGRIAGQQIGNANRHAPGWDGTFSAPKSVSVAALVGGDKRLIEAHDRAVRSALAVLEKHSALTRQRDACGGYRFAETGNLTAAIFRHASNRDQEPQLHSHGVMANATFDPVTGQWVSLWTKDGLYPAQREAGAAYMNELAREARALGYTIEWTVNDTGHPSFELAEIPAALREKFSGRTAAIDAELAARGLTRGTATPGQKEAATLATRRAKEHVPAAELHARWRDESRAAGFDLDAIKPTGHAPCDTEAGRASDDAVTAAVDHLAERSARFTERELLTEARVMAQGRAGEAELVDAIARAKSRGELIERDVEMRAPGGDRERVAGLTTAEGERIEKSMLAHADALARAGRHGLKPGERQAGENSESAIELRIADTQAGTGYELTPEQARAVHGVLAGDSGLHVLQGYAGTAKTTGVLATLSDHARAGGWEVRAMAPTSSAAKTLGEAIGAESVTVAGALERPRSAGEKRELWVIDESGMVSARDMNLLFAQADRVGARVLLVGDEKQIGSVGAGRAFEQVKAAHPVSTYELTDIKRQRSAELKQAVLDVIHGDVQGALDKVEVREYRLRDDAIGAMADTYMSKVAEGRDTLAVTISRADRDAINAAIQQRREAAGEVRAVREIPVLVDKQQTAAEKADIARWREGDMFQVNKRQRGGPRAGDLCAVTKLRADGRVTAEAANGKTWTFDPRDVATDITILKRDSARIGEGDRVTTKAGMRAEPLALDAAGGGLQQETRRGRLDNNTELTVRVVGESHIDAEDKMGNLWRIDTGRGARVDLGYAQTANQAQGLTKGNDRQLGTAIPYMRSSQTNLADQQRLYVVASRAKDEVILFTDDKQKLAHTIERNTGRKEQALDDTPCVERDAAAVRPSLAPPMRWPAGANPEPDRRERGHEGSPLQRLLNEPAPVKPGDSIELGSGRAWHPGGGEPVPLAPDEKLRVDHYDRFSRSIEATTAAGERVVVYDHPLTKPAPAPMPDRPAPTTPTPDRATARADAARAPQPQTLKDLAREIRAGAREALRDAGREWKRMRREGREKKFDRETKRILKDIDRRERETKRVIRAKYGPLSFRRGRELRKVEQKAAQARGKVQGAQLREWARRARAMRAPGRGQDYGRGR